jgi:hypothetical protein
MQILFLAGVGLTIGPAATVRFFMRRKNVKVGVERPGLIRETAFLTFLGTATYPFCIHETCY